MITAGQCRSARTLLSWSVSKLARTASISERDIDNFELERCKPHPATRDAIRRALEAAGAVFLPADDVRVRPCTAGGALIERKSDRPFLARSYHRTCSTVRLPAGSGRSNSGSGRVRSSQAGQSDRPRTTICRS
jgi:hypothetical protein